MQLPVIFSPKNFFTDKKLFAICLLCAIPLVFQVFKNYVLSARGWHVYEIQYSTISWIARLLLLPLALLAVLRLRSLLAHITIGVLFTATHIGLSMLMCLQTSSPDKRLWNLFNTVKNEALMPDVAVYMISVLICYLRIRSEKGQDPEPERTFDILTIKSGQRTHIVKLKDIFSITSQGHYVKVSTESKSSLMSIPLSEITNMLPPAFVRIHRSTVINTFYVVQTRSLMNGDYVATMKNGSQHKISRTYRDNLRKVLGSF
jgi:hypothetical protein